MATLLAIIVSPINVIPSGSFSIGVMLTNGKHPRAKRSAAQPTLPDEVIAGGAFKRTNQ